MGKKAHAVHHEQQQQQQAITPLSGIFSGNF
jgi:hypothetical protein